MFPFRDGMIEGPEVCSLILVSINLHTNQGVRSQWWLCTDLRAVLVGLNVFPASEG